LQNGINASNTSLGASLSNAFPPRNHFPCFTICGSSPIWWALTIRIPLLPSLGFLYFLDCFRSNQNFDDSRRFHSCPCKYLLERAWYQTMNRILLGALLGIAFGLIDVAITVFGNHPERNTTMLLQAFFSRFAIGLLAANVNLPMNPILAGALVGLLISLPDAFALKAYAGILGTGIIFGAIAGWVTKTWGT
jgi:hypothetical protein